MKKSLIVVLVLLMVSALVFTGCAAKEEPMEEKVAEVVEEAEEVVEEAVAEDIYIPVISKGFQHQFWQAVKMGADQAAADLGVSITFEGPESESAVAEQIDMIDAALQKNPAALCLAALDAKAMAEQLQYCADNNIPVIGFDSGVDSDIPVATAATDNLAAAALAADKMAELIGGSGKVAVIVHDQTSLTGIQRRDGFLNRMAEAYPDIEVLEPQYGGGDHAASTDIANAFLTANPDLSGIFGANEGSAIGALTAVGEQELEGKIIVIGFDAGVTQKDAIRSGVMSGAITQDPVGIGYKAVEAAVKVINGETVEEMIDTGFHWYNADNMDDPVISPLLYD
jgi:ribose transport system substrate-binding protein